MKWIMLLLYLDTGIVFYANEIYDTQEECRSDFPAIAKEYQDTRPKDCTVKCGQLVGLCIQGSMMLPGPSTK